MLADGTYGEIILYCLYSRKYKLYHPQQSIHLDARHFGWERENGLLTPAKFWKCLPVVSTVTYGCKSDVMVDANVDK